MLPEPYRLQFAARAALLILSGAAIAFTATLHDTLFSQTLFAISVLAVALGELIVGLSVAARRRVSALTVTQAILAILAAGSAVLVSNNLGLFALTVTLWAAVTALVEVWYSWSAARRSPGREIRIVGIMTGLLAVLLVVVPSSPASVIGLYGGYCFVAGVYMAIAAADRASETEAESEA